jgi:hypothetical protein
MTKRSNTENESASARAHGGFNRVASLIGASAEIARTTDLLAQIARRQIPLAAPALVPRIGPRPEMQRSASEGHIGSWNSPERNRDGAQGNAPRSTGADPIHAISEFATKVNAIDAVTRGGVLRDKGMDRVGFASGSQASIPPRETFNRETRWSEDATDSSRGSFARMIQQSSSGMAALTRIRNRERRFGVGNDSIFEKARSESGVARFEQGTGDSLSGLAGRAKRMLDGVGGFFHRSRRGLGEFGRKVCGGIESAEKLDGRAGCSFEAGIRGADARRLWAGVEERARIHNDQLDADGCYQCERSVGRC